MARHDAFQEGGMDLRRVEAKGVHRKGVIESLGLGKTILSWRANGMTYEEIGIRLGIDESLVRQWVKKYNEMPDEAKAAVEKRSIFDITARLEELFQSTYELLESARENLDGELQVKVAGEIRQQQKFALELMHALKQVQDMERFKEKVLAVFDRLAPGTRAEIARALTEDREMNALFRGF